jgi:hypothetical protein
VKTEAEYLKQADECETLARRAKTPEERDMILGMAATWRILAKQREQQIKTQALIDGMPDRLIPKDKPSSS